jgi:hypothetical protein
MKIFKEVKALKRVEVCDFCEKELSEQMSPAMAISMMERKFIFFGKEKQYDVCEDCARKMIGWGLKCLKK